SRGRHPRRREAEIPRRAADQGADRGFHPDPAARQVEIEVTITSGWHLPATRGPVESAIPPFRPAGLWARLRPAAWRNRPLRPSHGQSEIEAIRRTTP